LKDFSFEFFFYYIHFATSNLAKSNLATGKFGQSDGYKVPDRSWWLTDCRVREGLYIFRRVWRPDSSDELSKTSSCWDLLLQLRTWKFRITSWWLRWSPGSSHSICRGRWI